MDSPNVLGEERAFAEELHHKGEHSVELAAVWLHHFLGGRPCSIVPMLMRLVPEVYLGRG